LNELWAPLTQAQHQYIAGQLRQTGALAEEAGVPDADAEFWREQRDPESPGALVNHPGLFWCEGHLVMAGQRL